MGAAEWTMMLAQSVFWGTSFFFIDVIDGALGAQLLEAIVDNLESPLLMLA